MDLNSLKIFTEVIIKGSFSGASKSLGMPVSTVSRKVGELEEALGEALMERSTRSLRLTASGEVFFDYALRSVEEFEMGVVALMEKENLIEGTVRLAMPPNFEIGWDAVKRFIKLYPNVKVQTLGITREIDPIADHIDVVVQYNASQNPSVISRCVGTVAPKIVASRQYVEERGEPKTPQDLGNFECLARENPGSEPYWTLSSERVFIEPYITSNEFSFLRDLVRSHVGIAQLPPFYCEADLDSGEFVEVLSEYAPPTVELHVVYASRRNLSRVTRALIDHIFNYQVDSQPEHWGVN